MSSTASSTRRKNGLPMLSGELKRALQRTAIPLLVLLLAGLLGQVASIRYLGLIIAIAIGLMLIVDPRRGLLVLPGVALLVPLEIGTGRAVSLNSAVLIAPVAILAWFLHGIVIGKLSFVPSRLNRPLLALSAVIIFSLLRGNAMWDPSVPRPFNALTVQFAQITIYFLSFLTFWLTANVISDLAWLRKVVYTTLITGFAGLVIVFLARSTGLFNVPFEAFVTHNMFTIWMVGLSLGMAFHDDQLQQWQRQSLFLTAAFTIGVALMVWFRGGDWIGGWAPPLVAAIVVLWLQHPKLRLLYLVGLIILFFLIEPDSVTNVIDFETKWQVSGGSRVTIWRSVIELASRSPIFGLGIVAFRYYHYLKPLAYGNALWVNPDVSAHNMFVDMFAQLGIVGLICYIWFIIEAGLLAHRIYRKSTGFVRGYALATLAALIASLAADMLAATTLPFIYNLGFRGFRASLVSWMLLGGLVVLEQIDRQKSQPPTLDNRTKSETSARYREFP